MNTFYLVGNKNWYVLSEYVLSEYVLTEYVLTESFIMDQIGGRIGYYRTVRIIREYVLSRVRTKRVPLYEYLLLLFTKIGKQIKEYSK